MIPKLESKQQLNSEKQQAVIYEGVKGIMIMLNKFIENTQPGDNFYFFSVDVPGMNREIQNFFEKYDVKRKAKKLNVMGIARKELKSLYENRKLLKVKYVDFPIPSNLSMCNNKMVLINWGERPTGILIESEQLVKSQVSFFNNLWKIANY